MQLEEKILEEIGLTNSEVKVYLSLLKIGSSTKKLIVQESGISASKLYEVTDKLIQKGLVSFVKKNKVMHFSAAPPEQILDLLEKKKDKIEKQEKEFTNLIPSLKLLEKKKETEVEVFSGWDGMRTAYKMMLNSLSAGETDYVIGATSGENKEESSRFFTKIHHERRRKKIKLKIILNKDDKKWAEGILNDGKYDFVKFIKQTAPSEVNVWGDNVMVVLLTKDPVITLIKSKGAAESFRSYFNYLWLTASD